MNDARRDKHHFLARHLLAHFAADDGLLFVYSRAQEWGSRRDIPDRLAREKFLYAPETVAEAGHDPKDDRVERWLADEIDGPAAAPLAALVAGASLAGLTSDGKHAIADFVALLDLRTPTVRDLLVPAFASAASEAIANPKDTQRELRRKGVRVARNEVRRLTRDNRSRIVESLAKPAWLKYLKETRGIARINVKARRWAILETDSVEFVTSDLGMAKSRIGPLQPARWEAGTLNGLAHWIIPLCPWRALTLTPTHAPDPVSSRDIVEKTNAQLIMDARRYVYSRSPIPRHLLEPALGQDGSRGSLPGAV